MHASYLARERGEQSHGERTFQVLPARRAGPRAACALRYADGLMPDDLHLIFRVGDLLAGTYEVRELLGEGGMGQVFDAHDRNLNRRVAIKANWPEAPRTVRAEAQALAAIRHPGVVSVHALGTHQGVDFLDRKSVV